MLGLKVTLRVKLPTSSYLPDAGEYVNLPGTLAIASSWVELGGVPELIAAGVDQLKPAIPNSAAVLCVAVASLSLPLSSQVAVRVHIPV